MKQEIESEVRNFLNSLTEFRKLDVFRIVPEIGRGDLSVLKAVACCSGNSAEASENVKVSHLVKFLCCPPPVVSRSLKSLEGKGLIIRETNTIDRRNTFVYLTKEGKEVLDRADAVMVDFMNSVLRDMGEEEMHDFNEKLLRFQQIVKKEINLRVQKNKEKGDGLNEKYS